MSVDVLEPSSGPSRNGLILAFGAALAISLAAGAIPGARWLLYPFNLIATWAHEMGHGLGAMITGNRFIELELYQTLGGQALTAGADGWSQVVVSSAGLIGPALLGAVVMIAGSRPRVAPYVLGTLAVCFALSALIWIRNLFGFVAMLLLAAIVGAIARFAPIVVRIVLAQVLAVQMALSAWSSRDYLFIRGFERDGYHPSDTQRIAEELLLPYWFWGGLLGGLSVAILVAAFWWAWLRPHLQNRPQLSATKAS